MTAPQTDLAPPSTSRLAAIGGCLLAILGFKILLIARLGSPTPFWDQWAEATSVYLPYLSHTLTLDHLIAFHNEHRLLLTRATALALFVLNGTWDPLLQMLVGALVHVAAVGCLLVALGRTLDHARLMFLLALALLLCAVPFGWDNTLSGFQIQFYFLLLLSIGSLLLLSRARAWSAQWLIGTLLAVLGYFSVASGSLILPAAIVVALIQIVLGQRRGTAEFLGVALHVVLAALVIHDLLAYAPRTPTPDASVRLLFSSLMISASWPVAARSWPVILQIIPAALVYGPVLILAARLLRQRPALMDKRWCYVALAAWLAFQLIALSYARAGGTIQARYTDIFGIGVILNFAALLYLASKRTEPKPHKLLRCAAIVWIVAVMLGAGQKAVGNVVDDASFRHESGQRQTQNVKAFLATNDFGALDNKPTFAIPFPDAQALRDLLSNPSLRAILPPELTGVQQRRPMRDVILSQGPMLIPIGLALLLLSAMALLPRPKREDNREA
jgi:hypothetical protein